jgi:Major Facilitator Superfamily
MASLLASLGRGGLMFTLIIWLQGIYLPIHGYGFSQTPLWAGIAMLPLTIGFLIAGPASGWLSDRYGARPFATGGMVVAAASFRLLELLPVNFAYWEFAGILLLNGIGMGLFASPNRAGIMNSLPPERRGVGAGHERDVPELGHGAVHRHLLHADHPRPGRVAAGRAEPRPHRPGRAQGGRGPDRRAAARGDLVAALLGYNPVQALLGHAISKLPAGHAAYLTGHTFFPSLISAPFEHGLAIAFDFAIAACLIAGVASLLRGSKYVHELDGAPTVAATAADDVRRRPADPAVPVTSGS